MKLTGVKIHNFRGILDQDMVLKGYSLLVGPNNAGKSSIIDAIRAFYEKDGFKFKEGNDFPHVETEDEESWVELEFSLGDEEHESLADNYKNESKTLRVRKYFKTVSKTGDGKTKAGSIFGYIDDGTLLDKPFYGARNVQSGKFGDVVYVPAISKVDEHAKLSGPSALRDLLTDIMTDVVEGGEAYTEFSARVQEFSDSVRNEKTSDDRSLSGFESELNEMLRPWESEFKLKFPPPSAAEIIKSMLGWDLFDQFHGKPQAIDYYGSGFQRHFIYSLIQLGSRYVGKKATTKSKDFAPALTLVLFEEPEAFLHPPLQEDLAQNLRKFAETENWQVLCATHSPQFVSKNAADIPAIVRLRRLGGEIRKFQIGEADWNSIVDANQTINTIANKCPNMAAKLQTDDARPDMEAVKYFLWLNPDRASAFFANHVLLVEGPTEVALIGKLIDDEKIANVAPGFYVLDCMGKYNIHRFMNLLIHLGVSHSVIHDDDNNENEHAELNKLIKNTGHPGLTTTIKPVSGELEEILGLPDAGSTHRKPQHALYTYQKGQIDANKLDAFCKLVEGCLPSIPAPSPLQSGAPDSAP